MECQTFCWWLTKPYRQHRFPSTWWGELYSRRFWGDPRQSEVGYLRKQNHTIFGFFFKTPCLAVLCPLIRDRLSPEGRHVIGIDFPAWFGIKKNGGNAVRSYLMGGRKFLLGLNPKWKSCISPGSSFSSLFMPDLWDEHSCDDFHLSDIF